MWKHTGLLSKKVKIVLDIQAHFEEKITFFWEKREKSRRIPQFSANSEKFWSKFDPFGAKFCQFWDQKIRHPASSYTKVNTRDKLWSTFLFPLDILYGTNFSKNNYIRFTPNVPSPFILPCLRIPVPFMNRKPAHVVSLQPDSYK